MTQRIRGAAALVSCLLMGVMTTAQAGVIERHAPNQLPMFATAETFFVGSVTDAGPYDGAFGVASPGTPEGYVAGIDAESSLLPFSGAAKDGAEGRIVVAAELGLGPADDSFGFLVTGRASAVEALASDGSPAAASVRLWGGLMFTLDAAYGGVAPGSVVGLLQLPALPAAAPFASFTLQLFDGPPEPGATPLLSQGPGSAAVDAELRAGHSYALVLDYRFDVPHGIDPPFGMTVLVPLLAVPEPGGAALMLAGLAGLAALARRRADGRRGRPPGG